MPNIEKISAELHALMAGVDRARGLVAAADSQAREVAVGTAGAGFAAVAAGLVRVFSGLSSGVPG